AGGRKNPNFVMDLKSGKVSMFDVWDGSANPNVYAPTSIMVNPIANEIYVAIETCCSFQSTAGLALINGNTGEYETAIRFGQNTKIAAIDANARQIYVEKLNPPNSGEYLVIDATKKEAKPLQGGIPATATRSLGSIKQVQSPVTRRIYKVEEERNAVTI